MTINFSILHELNTNAKIVNDIDNCIRISLGPSGKAVLNYTKTKEIKFLMSGSLLLKALVFETKHANIILKLLEQASSKTLKASGDGSTTTLLILCQLLKSSLRFLAHGYDPIQISYGLRHISCFLMDKTWELSSPILNYNQLKGVLNTTIGKKLNSELAELLFKSILILRRDCLVLVEENDVAIDEVENAQGIELDRGFISQYFVNDLKNFEVVYENPYLLITNNPIVSISQIYEILEHIKKINRALIIIAEDISKDIISTLVLNFIQKKLKIVVIKYSSITFIKSGILEDLSALTHSNYLSLHQKNKHSCLTIKDLGHVEKAIIKKNKSIFLMPRLSKIIAQRKMNELSRELLISETDYERSLYKARIARLSGNIIKFKIKSSSKYNLEEERQKMESGVAVVKASLEEGLLPGGGIGFLYLREELLRWSYANLIGDEVFSMQIVAEALLRPVEELFHNSNIPKHLIFSELLTLGYPYGYDFMEKKIVHTINNGIIDSAKVIRLILWNSITLASTIITSE